MARVSNLCLKIARLKSGSKKRDEPWTRTEQTPKKRIVAFMSKLTGEKPDICNAQYDAMMAAIEHELLQGHRVRVPFVGSFQVKDMPRTLSRHPFDNELYITPPRRYIRFKFNNKFKQRIRNLTDEWVPKD
jgi:nucleoid DNA-binding protein